MKFSTREDIDVPVEFLFEQISDIDGFERTATRRGADVRRVNPGHGMAPGLKWEAKFRLRGKRRKVGLELVEITPPEAILLDGSSESFALNMRLSSIALNPRRSRLGVEFEVKPNNFMARVMLQSVRLGKSAIDRRFAEQVRKFAHEIERRYARA